MLAAGWGRVINTGSMHALVASPYKSAYNAAKHGIAGGRRATACLEKIPKDEVQEAEDHEIRTKKARIKAEKLRLKANKAELKVLEAEAAARKARERRLSLQSGTSTQDEASAKEGPTRDADSAIALEDNDAEAVAREMTKALDWSKVKTSPTKDEDIDEDEGQISDSSSRSPGSSPLVSGSSDLSDSESTSSSAPSSSISESESESDSVPEQSTSKRLHPTRVPPPPRRPPINTQHLCRSMLATGHCKRGAGCQYSHDLPDTLPSLDERKGKLKEKRKVRLGKVKAMGVTIAPVKERRKGLWQVMVEKEQEEERKQVLRAIVFMGENGMLGEEGGKDKTDSENGAA